MSGATAEKIAPTGPATSPVGERRWLSPFPTSREADLELRRLLQFGYQKKRQWTLGQMCRHLAETIEQHLVPPETNTPTPEQVATKQKFFGMVLAPGGMPEGAPLPPEKCPGPDCDDKAEVERLIAAHAKVDAYEHACIAVGRCGPVPTEEVRQLHLAHAAHHVSFLIPNGPARRGGLRFDSVDAAIADVETLRRGYVRAGNWSLAQICWHLDRTIEMRMKPGPFPADSPEQIARRPVLEQVLATGNLPTGLIAPDAFTPPMLFGKDSTRAIEEFLAALRKFNAFPGPFAPHRLFGTMPDAAARKQNFIHIAHHLSHVVAYDGLR